MTEIIKSHFSKKICDYCWVVAWEAPCNNNTFDTSIWNLILYCCLSLCKILHLYIFSLGLFFLVIEHYNTTKQDKADNLFRHWRDSALNRRFTMFVIDTLFLIFLGGWALFMCIVSPGTLYEMTVFSFWIDSHWWKVACLEIDSQNSYVNKRISHLDKII